ncbi:MAG: hypothetical protein DMF96_17760 [Acidobacteria bacterium]|nr:MAG: hypothetical protein DMF96_17760 [Acidobacteriota bacterium]
MDGMKISVAEAKNTLPKLIKAVEDGEQVTICRDRDWWKPMTSDEVDAYVDGR